MPSTAVQRLTVGQETEARRYPASILTGFDHARPR